VRGMCDEEEAERIGFLYITNTVVMFLNVVKSFILYGLNILK